MLSAWQGDQTGGTDRSEQKTERRQQQYGLGESRSSTLWFPSPAASPCFPECLQLRVPGLCTELISRCSLGCNPIPSSLNSGASTKEASAPPSNVPGKSQDWANQQLSRDRPCLPASCWILSLSPKPVSSHPLSPGHTWFFRRRHDFTVYFYPAHC